MNHEPSDSRSESTNYYEQAHQYYLAANYDTAMIYLNQALEFTDTVNYQEVAKILILRSTVFGNFAQFENSMEDALEALSISERHHLIGNVSFALLSIGKIHYMMYNDGKAEEFMLKAKTVAEENELQNELMKISGSLGELYSVLGRSDEALPLLNRALEIAKRQSDTLHIIQFLRNLGDYHNSLNRYEIVKEEYHQTAKKYLDEALDLALKNNLNAHVINIKLSLIRWCRVEKNYIKALEYAEGILQIADRNNHTFLIQLYNHLVAIYAWLGDAEQVIQSHQQFRSMMVKQSDEKLHRSLQEMNVKYETAEKEHEIERQQAEIERNRTMIIAAVLLMVLLVYAVVLRTKRNRELTENNAVKDKFFSIISHDLKNPADAQRYGLKLLADNATKWDTATIAGYSDKLLKSADGLVDLLQNLLGWAQIQTGRKTYQPSSFNLIAVLRPDIAVIKGLAERKNIAFETHTPETAIITGDDNMITTVIRNLLANAVKFTPEGGAISLQIADNKGKITVTVSDAGTGMTAEQLQNLYRLDVKQSRPGTSGEEGTGLGLIVCRDLLEKHGTTLHVESEEGKGSRFWFVVGKG